MGLREQKREQLRRRLHETATALFRERGFEATRVRDIIDRVEVSEATFFNYFSTKEAVLHQSELEFKELYTIYLRELLARWDEPVAVRVREMVSVIGQVFADDREFMATLLGRTAIFHGSTGRAKEKDMENFGLLAELLGQGQTTGELATTASALQLAEILTATYMLTISNWITGWWGDIGDLEPRLTSAVDVFFLGCSVDSLGERMCP